MGNNAPKSAESIMTPANIITMVRICLVPVFVVAIISPSARVDRLCGARRVEGMDCGGNLRRDLVHGLA